MNTHQEETKKKKDQEKEEKDEKKDWKAINRYNKWKRAGKPKEDGKPKFEKSGHATDILKIILPKIDLHDTVLKYDSGKKSLNQLLKMTDWEAEIENLFVRTSPKIECFN